MFKLRKEERGGNNDVHALLPSPDATFNRPVGEQGMTRYAIVVEIDGKDQEHSRYARLDEARYVFYAFGFERSFKNARIVEITE